MKPIHVIFLTVFMDLVGFGIVLPLLPTYSKSFGASGMLSGIIIASYSAMQFLFAPAWGALSDRIGRRPVLLVSTAFLASGYIRSVELLRAIQRRAAREAEIAIVLLEPNVQWKGERTIHDKATCKDVKFKLDAWQATLPDGRCVRDFSTQQIGFNAVEAALRTLIASVLARRRPV